MLPCLLPVLSNQYAGALGDPGHPITKPLLAAVRALAAAAALRDDFDLLASASPDVLAMHVTPFIPMLMERDPPTALALTRAGGTRLGLPPYLLALLDRAAVADGEVAAAKRKREEAEAEAEATKRAKAAAEEEVVTAKAAATASENAKEAAEAEARSLRTRWEALSALFTAPLPPSGAPP